MHLAIATGRRAANDVKNVWRQNIASDHRKVGRCLVLWWFFHHLGNAGEPGPLGSTRNHAIFVDFLHGYFLHRDNGTFELSVERCHLRQHAGAIAVQAKVVGQHHAEGLRANQRLTGQNSVAEPQHLSLAHHGEDAAIDDVADALEILLL